MSNRTCKLLVVVVTGCLFVFSTLSAIGSFQPTRLKSEAVQMPVERASPTGLESMNALAQNRIGNVHLRNANFECSNGVYEVTDSSGQVLTMPNDWNLAPISGTPKLISTRIQVNGECGGSGFVDRLEGEDSFMFRAEDIETPPEPGKPFDVAIYQQVGVITGTDYSVGGFMSSFCGGSASPTDCPEGNYIGKMIGLDPKGGTNPLADSVVWVESRAPHVTARYVHLSITATATEPTMTIFVRIQSPFQWHGNHAIVDLFSMVEAPTITLTDLPETIQITGTAGIPGNTHIVRGRSTEISWDAELNQDIEGLEGEGYAHNVQVQYMQSGETTWTPMVENHNGDGCQVFVAPSINQTYLFRARTLALRPTTGGHRYPSVWSTPVQIHFLPAASSRASASAILPSTFITTPAIGIYLPAIHHPISLVCAN